MKVCFNSCIPIHGKYTSHNTKINIISAYFRANIIVINFTIVIGFTENPMSLNLTSEGQAIFRGTHPHTTNFIWLINGTSSNVHLPPNTTVTSDFIGGRGVSNLNFPSCYNNTDLQCLAYFEENVHEESDRALMRCQGLYHNDYSCVRHCCILCAELDIISLY